VNVAVVLPAYNEAGNITPLVTELAEVARAASLPLTIIVVDDGSADGTRGELERLQPCVPGLHVIAHATNLGLASALKTGIAAACHDHGCDAAVFMDCDLSHRPAEFPRLVAALEAGADVALGSRFVPGGRMVGVPAWRAGISRAGNILGRRVLSLSVRDLTTGYRAVRRHVLESVPLGEAGFTIQLEAVVKAAAAGFRIVEVPITLGTRRHGESHMNYSVRLFANYFRLLLKCRRWIQEGRARRALAEHA
jgi:dolichol-phosphate mannosyltransferase